MATLNSTPIYTSLTDTTRRTLAQLCGHVKSEIKGAIDGLHRVYAHLERHKGGSVEFGAFGLGKVFGN
jgi:hypothetical protein